MEREGVRVLFEMLPPFFFDCPGLTPGYARQGCISASLAFDKMDDWSWCSRQASFLALFYHHGCVLSE